MQRGLLAPVRAPCESLLPVAGPAPSGAATDAPMLNPIDRFFQEWRCALAGRVYASLVVNQEALAAIL